MAIVAPPPTNKATARPIRADFFMIFLQADLPDPAIEHPTGIACSKSRNRDKSRLFC
jgi:hypothetical protein